MSCINKNENWGVFRENGKMGKLRKKQRPINTLTYNQILLADLKKEASEIFRLSDELRSFMNTRYNTNETEVIECSQH